MNIILILSGVIAALFSGLVFALKSRSTLKKETEKQKEEIEIKEKTISKITEVKDEQKKRTDKVVDGGFSASVDVLRDISKSRAAKNK